MRPTQVNILKELKSALSAKLGGNLKQLILFGSQLSGASYQNSDYDIIILLKNKPDWKTEREISDACYDIDLKYNILTDTHILGEDELESPRGRQPIFSNAIKQGYYA